MDRREFLIASGAVAAGFAISPFGPALNWLNLPFDAEGNRYVEGVVFHDRSGEGVRQSGDRGIAGVCVSNGRDVVKTDSRGRWRLAVDEDDIIFVIKPSGWKVPVDPAFQLPRFYTIHKPKGSPDYRYKGVDPTGDLPPSVDFGLQPQKEDKRFKMVLFGDPQPRNQTEINYMAHDVIEQVIRDAAAENAKFGMSLGDEMFDVLNLYESQNRTIGKVGIPWYNVVGNHDLNFDAPDNSTSTETFQRVFGPTCFAFNYGQVHFIVINDVVWEGKAKARYHGEITREQLEFVKNDLIHVPNDQLVVIAMHIPITGVDNKEELFRLIEHRPYTLSFSAHTHVQRNLFLTEKDGWKGKVPHHHLNHATVCGSWWRGATDERGIPHATMSDGGPNGYSIVEFSGRDYKVSFRPASRPAWDQMRIWLPEELTSVEAGRTEVIVNVFAGSEKSVVEMSIDGSEWEPMQQFTGKDPHYVQLKALETSPKPPNGSLLPGPSDTPHLWKVKLPRGLKEGTHKVDVRTTDMYGQVYKDQRIFRVVG